MPKEEEHVVLMLQFTLVDRRRLREGDFWILPCLLFLLESHASSPIAGILPHRVLAECMTLVKSIQCFWGREVAPGLWFICCSDSNMHKSTKCP